jgi:hypothetical protein
VEQVVQMGGHLQLTVVAPGAQASHRLDRGGALPLGVELVLEDPGRRRQRTLVVTSGERDRRTGQVAWRGVVDLVGSGQGQLRIEEGLQHVVLDGHETGGGLGRRRRFGDHGADGIADEHGPVADHRLDRRRLREALEGMVLPQVVGRHHGDDPGHPQRLGLVEGDDASPRMRGSDHGGVEHPGDLDVRDVGHPTGRLGPSVRTRKSCADDVGGVGRVRRVQRAHRVTPRAVQMASTGLTKPVHRQMFPTR